MFVDIQHRWNERRICRTQQKETLPENLVLVRWVQFLLKGLNATAWVVVAAAVSCVQMCCYLLLLLFWFFFSLHQLALRSQIQWQNTNFLLSFLRKNETISINPFQFLSFLVNRTNFFLLLSLFGDVFYRSFIIGCVNWIYLFDKEIKMQNVIWFLSRFHFSDFSSFTLDLIETQLSSDLFIYPDWNVTIVWG